MQIDLKNNCIEARFPYNEKIILAIKRYRGAYWNNVERCWLIPAYTSEILESFIKDTLIFSPVLMRGVSLKLEEIAKNKERERLLPSVSQEVLEGSVLKDFQKEGIRAALEKKSFLIADSMGLGKSASAIHYAEIRHRVYGEKILIVCPVSLIHQWHEEILKWLPNQEICKILGSKTKRQNLWKDLKKWNVCGYETFRSDSPDIKGLLLILDEASKCKNPNAKVTHTIRQKRMDFSSCLLLTGTPIENRLEDFWNILSIVKPNWMSKSEFYGKYCIWDKVWAGKDRGDINKIVGYCNLEGFRERASPYFIRRRKEEVTDLLPKNYEVRIVDFTPEQKKIERYLTEIVANTEDINNALVLMTFLRINASEPRALMQSNSESIKIINVTQPSKKIEEVKDIINETDCKIILFTQFSKVAKLISESFDKDCCLVITGECKNKDELIGKFKTDEKKRLLIATDCMAYGHSIDCADILINYDLPYGFGKISQREDRIHRIDSVNQKTVITLVSGDIENYVCGIVKNKIDLNNNVFDGEQANNLLSKVYEYVRRR